MPIHRLEFLDEARDSEKISLSSRLVVVLVQEALATLQPEELNLPDISARRQHDRELAGSLAVWREDLIREGWAPRFLNIALPTKGTMQDGRIVLAIRSVFKAILNRWPRFAGACLVGDFPDATIVSRSFDINSIDDLTTTSTSKVSALILMGGPTAFRSDLVYGDLRGNWDGVYLEHQHTQDTLVLSPPPSNLFQEQVVTGRAIPPTNGNDPDTFSGVFYLDDAQYRFLSRVDDSVSLALDGRPRIPEILNAERFPASNTVNRIATPDIAISRIDPVGISGRIGDITDDNGNSILDDHGHPRSFKRQTLANDWRHRPLATNLDHARELLIDYLGRAHRFRTGAEVPPRSIAVAAFPRTDFKARDYVDFLDEAVPKSAVHEFEEASLVDAITFLKQRALFKGISAHAQPDRTEFGQSSRADVESALGGPVLFWDASASAHKFVPSVFQTYSNLGGWIFRSLRQHAPLSGVGSFYLHNGCDVSSPGKDVTRIQYDEADREEHISQHCDMLLFYGGGLTVLSRAKTFNDRPQSVPAFIGHHPDASWGEAWLDLFRFESRLHTNSPTVRRRAYSWNLSGDWTLRPLAGQT